ncbi:MAG: hypothetical protein FWE84_04220 [Firmicutes bacterium]|nr:hypothetical protein [Bacillota bacterium]
MAKKFKVKQRENFTDKILRAIGALFKRSPKFTDLNEEAIEKKSILIGNHYGAGGPYTYRTHMKHRFMTWGAHQMCEGFKSRWRYLYHVFYRQKKGYRKFPAWIMASLFSLASRWVYGFAGVIPIYYDLNIAHTFKYSFECLSKDVSVFVFPENSNEGYKEIIEEFYPGFLKLAQLYYNKFKVDLPIYTLFFSARHKRVIVGKPMYLQELKKELSSEQEILDCFRNYMNSLYIDIIIKEDEERKARKRAKKKVKS